MIILIKININDVCLSHFSKRFNTVLYIIYNILNKYSTYGLQYSIKIHINDYNKIKTTRIKASIRVLSNIKLASFSGIPRVNYCLQIISLWKLLYV